MSRKIQIDPESNGQGVIERQESQTIFELSEPGRTGFSLPAEADDTESILSQALPAQFRRETPPALPEVSELTVMRHFTHLSGRTMGVETTFYPLGSCTMKYNPKINEYGAWLPGFTNLHPDQPEQTQQGLLEAYYHVQEILGELTGLPAVSLQPAAGAHGEFTCLLMTKAYFADRGETERTEVIIPDTAHGTNPASAYRVGLDPVEIKSDKRGRIDVESLRKVVGPKTACLMVTNPNTIGLFEDNLKEAAELVHQAGGLVYIDGANFNAIVGRVRPVDFGGDMMHINLHKTFSIPHGGGGPGAGPIVVQDFLRPYLPRPTVVRNGDKFAIHNDPKSIGKIRSYYGNVAHVVRAYAYLRQLGVEGLRAVSDFAVLNANYLLALLTDHYDIPYGNRCMHEFVIDATRQRKQGVKAVDIAKKLIDYGFHPPTTYFPLIVPEAIMIEPTETENKEMLELFAATMIDLARNAETDADKVVNAPLSTPVQRLDELGAARNPIVTG